MFIAMRTISSVSAGALAVMALVAAGCAGGSGTSAANNNTPPAVQPAPHTPQDFSVQGLFVEACTCDAVCACEMVGLEMGCKGVGAMQLSSGRYMGTDISGVKIVYAGAPGKWMRFYIDAKPGQRVAAEEFARAVYSAWGPVESVNGAKIDIQGSAGAYSVVVDDGRIMKYQTAPILGADKKTAVEHSNIPNNHLNTTLYQGRGVSCTFEDGTRSFEIPAGQNAFFNDHMNASGKI